jgi:hypothetical protein
MRQDRTQSLNGIKEEEEEEETNKHHLLMQKHQISPDLCLPSIYLPTFQHLPCYIHFLSWRLFINIHCGATLRCRASGYVLANLGVMFTFFFPYKEKKKKKKKKKRIF